MSVSTTTSSSPCPASTPSPPSTWSPSIIVLRVGSSPSSSRWRLSQMVCLAMAILVLSIAALALLLVVGAGIGKLEALGEHLLDWPPSSYPPWLSPTTSSWVLSPLGAGAKTETVGGFVIGCQVPFLAQN